MQTNQDVIVFEQPLNEHMRIFLRLEYLFKQLQQNLDSPELKHNRLALNALLKSLELIDRPDLKSKLTQTLTQLATSLAQLEHSPQVDKPQLQVILSELDKHINKLHHNHQRLGEKLRSNEFLNQVRLQLSNPGGTCGYKTPAFTLWMHRSDDERLTDLHTWANELSDLMDIVKLTLLIMRQSTATQTLQSAKGFYHQNLDPNLPCQLVRVSLPKALNAYPEFSVGKHRLSIRFLTPDFQKTGRPTPLQEDFAFELSCCRV